MTDGSVRSIVGIKQQQQQQNVMPAPSPSVSSSLSAEPWPALLGASKIHTSLSRHCQNKLALTAATLP